MEDGSAELGAGYAKPEERYYLKDELYDLDGDWAAHMHITEALPEWIYEPNQR